MEKYVIEGGKKLKGDVRVSGAKNSALKLMAASLLTDEPTTISNAPFIRDVLTMVEVLKELGAEVEIEKGKITIKPSLLKSEAPYELVGQMRASIIVLGPLLAKLGKAKVAMPGGCNIGSRKIDIHLKGLATMGADIEVRHGFIEARADRLKGCCFVLDYPSVGATENLLMAAVLAEGATRIENAACEPEIADLANFLNQMGAKVEGAGTHTIEVEGVKNLRGVSYSVLPDRIEAGTFMVAGAITRGEVRIKDANASHLALVISKLKEAGVDVDVEDKDIIVRGSDEIKAVDVATLPYPGFPTDMQPQMAALLTLAQGTSVITENIFDSRFLFAEELRRMGADIKIQGHHAIIRGVEKLSSATVRAADLRGGAALVLATLAAEGRSEVLDIYHIDRGYENFEEKLRGLGARIERVREKDFEESEAVVWKEA